MSASYSWRAQKIKYVCVCVCVCRERERRIKQTWYHVNIRRSKGVWEFFVLFLQLCYKPAIIWKRDGIYLFVCLFVFVGEKDREDQDSDPDLSFSYYALLTQFIFCVQFPTLKDKILQLCRGTINHPADNVPQTKLTCGPCPVYLPSPPGQPTLGSGLFPS